MFLKGAFCGYGACASFSFAFSGIWIQVVDFIVEKREDWLYVKWIWGARTAAFALDSTVIFFNQPKME